MGADFVTQIMHPEDIARFPAHLERLERSLEGEICDKLSGINIDITERKQAEEKLRQSEQHLRRILDSLSSFVGVLTPDGILIEANRTAIESANLQPEDVLHKPFAETYWWSYAPKIQVRLNHAIQQAAAGEVVRYDVTVRLDADKFIPIDFSLVPLFDANGQVEYLIPSGIDISDREASKQALLQREYELRLITEVIPQQVWTALPNGEVDYINQRWQEYTGVTLKQIRESSWSTIVHPDDLQRVSKTWNKAIETGKNYNIKARLRSADGSYHWFLGRARPLRNERGEIIKWYGTNTDISRIKELEEKLRQQTEDLIRANQLKDEFLAIVSHELRTPLNPILGWSQLITAGRLNPEQTAKGLETIQRNAKLQSQLIDDLLDVSRILRGKLDLKVTPLNIESVIRSALATVQLAAEAKSIHIETVFEPDIGQVSGDASRLQQIVWNLLSNAIKFTPEGGRVTVTLERVSARAQIQVKDTGKGIEPEFLPYVFDRFSQAESSSTRKFGGLGLGLAIVRHLTELHGGTVSADSSGEGQGATFSVKLPLMNVSITEQSNSESSERSVNQNRLQGIQVLVVDDEVDSLDILTIILEPEGAEVTPVASANAAIEALNRSTPDLIISDIGMPEVDGYTMLSQIRELTQGKDIPAIALTAYAGEVNRQRSLDVGFQQHISKPINITELITVVTLLTRSS
ncbi:MAG: ATP-binding protein [Xenococcaceae cyanobacterium MO_188.B32]|nr:ATP-binding protein [Xenococcaceae cyanobacterium MO_188.B32]